MVILLILFGIILVCGFIKQDRLAATGVIVFWILELLFRDFGIFRFSNDLTVKTSFFAATIILGFSMIRLIKRNGDENK